MYEIDHNGIDGKWRVFWTAPDGCNREMLFPSRESAQRWVDAMEAY